MSRAGVNWLSVVLHVVPPPTPNPLTWSSSKNVVVARQDLEQGGDHGDDG